MKKTTIALIGLFLIGISSAYAQIRILVSAPKLLMSNKPIYMASSLNTWHPADDRFLLKKLDASTYFIDLPDTLHSFEYKFTQGSWNTVEGDSSGRMRINRLYVKAQEANPHLIKNTITGWEKRSEFVLHITKLPENTPQDTKIYVAGTFNNWKVADNNYLMEKQFDGTYKSVIFTDLDKIEFKFNRGNWESVEVRKNGRPRPNRELEKSKIDANKDVSIEIENWEDLTGTFNFFSLFDLLLLFAAFQGILLSIVIPSMQDFNREANRYLVILISFTSLMIFIKVLSNFRDVANLLPKLMIIPNFLLFTYAPLYYLYIQKLLFQKRFFPKDSWKHFIPFAIQFLLFLPYFFLEGKKFQYKVVNEELDLMIIYGLSYGGALLINTYYWTLCRKSINAYKEKYINQTSFHQNINYLSNVIIIQAICIVLCYFTAVLYGIQYLAKMDISEVTENSVNTIWLTFSTIIYFLGYYAIHQPEIFKLSAEEIPVNTLVSETEPVVDKNAEVNKIKLPIEIDENILLLKDKVMQYFDKSKPHLDPSLTLNDLANHLKIPTHTLSKVINEGFNKNFFDFVNTYRIEEFKARIDEPKYRNYTLLSLAFEVGFNSKTAFNRAFKKITNQTPSEYYQSRKI